MSRALRCLVLAAGIGALGVASCAVPKNATTPLPAHAADAERGAVLFAAHCALCHGDEGRGDGDAAPFLFPAPRDFGRGDFRLVSTGNGAPTDADLERTLRRGMPGSTMPSFGWMPQSDLDALVSRVRQLAEDGMVDDLVTAGYGAADARARAVVKFTPDGVIDAGPPAADTPDHRARGAALYRQHCAACHGNDGRGQKPDSAWNERGEFQWARDFTAGVMKGGATHQDLVWRMRTGLAGSVMHSTMLEPADAAALALHVRGLLPAGAAERLVQRRQRIVARRQPGELPTDPDDGRWNQANEAEIALAPLIWKDGSVVNAAVTALHDGKEVAIRLHWRDATRDDRPLQTSPHCDAAALQFSAETAPPLFGMGSRRHPVNIWHWKPFAPGDVSAMLEQVPHRNPALRGELDVPIYVPAASAPGAGRTVQAEGLRSAPRFRGEGEAIDTHARWRDDHWSVIFRRALAGKSPDIDLRPGSTVQLAGAIWNGAARNDDSQKSITIWHELVIE